MLGRASDNDNADGIGSDEVSCTEFGGTVNDQLNNVDYVSESAPLWIGTDQLQNVLTYEDAVAVLEQTILDGFNPEEDGVRTRHSSPSGTLLQMPSASQAWCGTKLVTLRDADDPTGLPAIQGVYVLFDGQSLQPVAMVEGAGLTALRTPAMTALAIKYLAHGDAGRVALFGTGVQARAHVKALMAVFRPDRIDVIGRTAEHAQRLSDEISDMGIESSVSDSQAVSKADVILCCTASAEPLFDGTLVQDHAIVAAIGSHDPRSREVDAVLVERSTVVVESQESAMREAGDLIIPNEAGEFAWDRAITIRDVILGEQTIDFERPRLFKGTGMPWQDLAVASSAYVRTAEFAS